MAGIGSLFAGFKSLAKPLAKDRKRSESYGDLGDDLSAFERALEDAKPALLERGKLRTFNECSKFILDTKELIRRNPDSNSKTNQDLQERRSSALVSRLHGYILLLSIAVNSPPPGPQACDSVHELDAVPISESPGVPIYELDAREIHELEAHHVRGQPVSRGPLDGAFETTEPPLPLILQESIATDIIEPQTGFQGRASSLLRLEDSSPYSYPPSFSNSNNRSSTSLTTLSSSLIFPSLRDRTPSITYKENIEFAKALKEDRIDVATVLKCIKDGNKRSQLNQESVNNALAFVAKHQKRKAGQIEAINVLVDQCAADIEYRDEKYGRTPLIWAINVGREDVVSLLLDHNAFIEGRDSIKSCTPLIWAVCLGNETITRLLVSRGASLRAADAEFQRTPLLWATKRGAFKVAQVLLEFIQDPNILDIKDRDGKTALALAYTEKHPITATALLDCGSDPNFTFKSGRPLIISAIMAKDVRFVRLLLSKGASKHATDKDGLTAQDWALRMRDKKMIGLVCSDG
ncbi:hypothetical protein LOZ12_004653 [Ophidiomyces ophidiicola]|uniref:Uncharacterized protein n=1 Tax=Ophidiomyces ophidiicola TaxID=1387563 RepID=A0ACB8USN1_9EURO|nr:hypothetical protein LOZ64_004955 [Ophidiomyces ophidiicola]KAI1943134.1 hypothetical protein LOZ62_004379 [Ophidiomyces ophidiicola]KAI1969909.1 hypothetical protein LOZ56_004079 [Ophidiomyces ophidiicola]KAI2002460.1 hypothetical protein LOZ50_004987 [Ophidiomyces ophidiicola]KAI2011125.1 hypothetical protein LOZ49_003230 [Ophidiomyces ophidiicola]